MADERWPVRQVYLILTIRLRCAHADQQLLRAAVLQNLLAGLEAEFPEEVEAERAYWKEHNINAP